MAFDFEYRYADSPLIDLIWSTYSVGGGSFVSSATTNLEIVITRQKNGVFVGVRGPETKASPAPIPEDAEFLGIQFRLGTFIPPLPTPTLVDGGVYLPQASGRSFWLHGSAWEFPSFENADVFVDRLVRQGLLAYEPVVEAALQGQTKALSERSIQRRIVRATGLTHSTIFQIQRAHRAKALLEQGVSILDTVEQAGYYDQPHLTRSLKRFIGQTPAELLAIRNNE